MYTIHEADPQTYVPDIEAGIKFYREDFREMVRKNIDICISEGTPFDYEAAIITINNKERWVHAIGYSEFVDGKCIRLYGSIQDISRFK